MFKSIVFIVSVATHTAQKKPVHFLNRLFVIFLPFYDQLFINF